MINTTLALIVYSASYGGGVTTVEFQEKQQCLHFKKELEQRPRLLRRLSVKCFDKQTGKSLD
jgi:hypothetical protein